MYCHSPDLYLQFYLTYFMNLTIFKSKIYFNSAKAEFQNNRLALFKF